MMLVTDFSHISSCVCNVFVMILQSVSVRGGHDTITFFHSCDSNISDYWCV